MKEITARRIYHPPGISVAHIDVTDRVQVELWYWWHWGDGKLTFEPECCLAEKLPLCRAIRERTAILTAEKRRGYIVLIARLP